VFEELSFERAFLWHCALWGGCYFYEEKRK